MGADLFPLKACVVLYNDHRAVQRLLRANESSLVAAARPADFAQRLGNVIDGLMAELPRHFAKEEEGLFPVLESVTGHPFPPIEVMREEHRVLQEHMAALCEARDRLAAAPGNGDARAVALRHGPALIATLDGHIEKEDGVLLHIASDELSQAHDAKVMRVFEQVEREGRKW
jgi:hemerythrin-like domain-containing protein